MIPVFFVRSNDIDLMAKECKSKTAKIQDLTTQCKNLTEKLLQQSIDLRTLRREIFYCKAKFNVIKPEIEQLTKQKDCVTKKLLQNKAVASSYQQKKNSISSKLFYYI